jgi:hypothetical protein
MKYDNLWKEPVSEQEAGFVNLIMYRIGMTHPRDRYKISIYLTYEEVELYLNGVIKEFLEVNGYESYISGNRWLTVRFEKVAL